jgi:hypothetical protein
MRENKIKYKISSSSVKIKKYLFLISFLLFHIFFSVSLYNGLEPEISENHIASSCTIFTVAMDDTVYFGNNEDYNLENAYQWYIPSQNITTRYGIKEIYGGVFLGFDNNDQEYVDTWPQGGMNEYGLCYDANGLPKSALVLDRNMSFPYSEYALSQVMWECRNVEEVINWYQSHRWFSLSCQIHYADKSGDAVVVSANTTTGKWAFTRKNSTFLVSTNFNLDDNENGHYPCSRYITATQMLGEITENNLTISTCADVLYEVHQEGTYGTLYSNIFDPVNLDIYFNQGKQFSKYEKINLLEKLTGEESFEEKETFFGMTGPEGYISVKTVKINILFRTVNPITISIVILGVLGVICISIRLFKRSKTRKKEQ